MSTTNSSWEDTIQEEESPEVSKSSWEDTIQEEPPPNKEYSKLEAAGLGLASGAIPFEEQVIPAVKTAFSDLDEKKSLLDAYYEAQKQYKQAKELASEQQPEAYYTGAGTGLVGSLFTGGALAKGASSLGKASSAAKLLSKLSKTKAAPVAEAALSGVSTGESEILKGDVENLPQEALMGVGGGLIAKLGTKAVTGLASTGKKLGEEGLSFIKQNIPEVMVKTPYRYGKETGKTIGEVTPNLQDVDYLENKKLDDFYKAYKKQKDELIKQTSSYRKQADEAGLTADLSESLKEISPESLGAAGKETILRAAGEDPITYKARLDLLKKIEEARLSGKEIPEYDITKAVPESGKLAGAVASPAIEEETSKIYAKLGVTKPGEILNPEEMSATQINKLKARLYSLPEEDRKLPEMRALIKDLQTKERELAKQISPEYENLIKKQQASIEVGQLTGYDQPLSSSTQEGLLAAARDEAKRKFQKIGKLSEQLPEEMKQLDPNLAKIYKDLEVFRQAQRTRETVRSSSIPSAVNRLVISGAGVAGKLANKIDTSDAGLAKTIRRLRSIGGESAKTAFLLANKVEELYSANPTARTQTMFSLMQQPAYQEFLSGLDNDQEENTNVEE